MANQSKSEKSVRAELRTVQRDLKSAAKEQERLQKQIAKLEGQRGARSGGGACVRFGVHVLKSVQKDENSTALICVSLQAVLREVTNGALKTVQNV